MRYLLIVCSSLAVAVPALAQTPTPPPAAGDVKPQPRVEPSPNPPERSDREIGRRPAAISLRTQDGALIRIRCAEGETSKACSEVALQMLDRLQDSRRDMDRDSWRDRDRDRYRY